MNPEGLSVALELDQPQYEVADKQILQFSLTNTSNKSIKVLKWHTPLEGFNSDMFRIVKKGKPAVYLGRIVRRGKPTQKDYVTIEPRESMSVKFDLVEIYDISEAGGYSVQFKPTLLDYRESIRKVSAARSKLIPKPVRSNMVKFRLHGNREPRQVKGMARENIADLAETTARVPPAFEECSANQQNTLDTALTEAEKISSKSYQDLSCTVGNERPIARRFREWFGDYTSTRYGKVIGNFEKIHDALANKAITFNCDCNEGWYAYVFPTKPYEIYLCNLFWISPLTGAGSQADTLVHEVSHFNVVAGTVDELYGQQECRQLAIDDPLKAIENADSYAFFSANDPVLSMGMCATQYATQMLAL